MARQLKPDPIVKIGQVWKDNDKRQRDRFLRVVGLMPTHAICEVWYGSACYPGTSLISHSSVIALRRFRPTSTGYLLVKNVS